MSTLAQRHANQINARLSTGPRTPEGKQASSRNAIRHNLSGTTFILLPTEDRAGFDALVRDYANEWKPRSPHETFLVHQMVQARWRLNRIARMEAEIYDTMFERFGDDKSDEGAIIVGDAIQPDHTLRRLHRYAQDAERSYYRAIRELKAHRKAQTEEKKQNTVAQPAARNEPNLATNPQSDALKDEKPASPLEEESRSDWLRFGCDPVEARTLDRPAA